MNDDRISYLEAFGEQLERRAQQDANRRLPRRRRLALWAATAAAVVASAGGAAYAVLKPAADITKGIACYATADASGTVTAIQADGRLATDTCAELWRRGMIGNGNQDVPTLQACADPDNKLAVKVIPAPSPSACSAIGLRSDSDAGAGSGPYARTMATLWHRAGTTCLNAAQAQALAEEVARSNGLDWRVVIDAGDTAGPSCADYGVNGADHVIGVRMQPSNRPNLYK